MAFQAPLKATIRWSVETRHCETKSLFIDVAGNLIHAKAQDEGSGPPTQTTGPEGNVKVARLMGAVEYGRPLAQHWNGTLGVNFQRANCLDDHNQPMTKVSFRCSCDCACDCWDSDDNRHVQVTHQLLCWYHLECQGHLFVCK